MKARSFLAFASLFVLVLNSCGVKEELYGEESISISPSEASYTFPAEGGEYVIELTSTLDWALQGYDDDVKIWLSITPTAGSASSTAQTITIEALKNDSYSRSASITFYGNILNKVTLTITQEGAIELEEEGDGTAENPYSVWTAMQVIDNYGYTYNNPSEDVYVKGIITEITEVDTGTYGNATYYISDSEDSEYSIYVYRGYYLESTRFTSEDQIAVGDSVVVCGQLMLFYQSSVGIYEIGQSNYIYSHNGVTEADQEPEVGEPSGDGSLDNPYNVAGARQEIAENGWDSTSNTSDYVYVEGVIYSIASTEVSSYGSVNYYIKDEDYDNSLYVYGGKYLNNESFTSVDQIQVGDKVIICGKLLSYNGTYEFTGGNYLYSLNGETGEPGDPGSDEAPTSAEQVTIAEFLEKEVSTTVWYELTGTITSITGTSYGNFYMEDSTGSVYVYGLVKAWANGSNDQSFSSIGLEVGDEVTIWTLRAEYSGSAQAGGTPPAIYISHTEGVDPVYPDGSVTLTFPDDNSENNGVGSYTSTWTAMSGEYTWSIYAFNNNSWNNNWTYIKCGRSGNASVATITTTTPIPATVASVEITFDSMNSTYVNSIYLSVYSDADCTEQVGSNIELSDISAGTKSFEIPAANQGANLYYKLTFDCASASGNGPVWVSKLVYLATE